MPDHVALYLDYENVHRVGHGLYVRGRERDPGCCAGPEERESWACECLCHAERRSAWIMG